MSASERRLAADRATRDAARTVFTARLAQVRSDLDERGVGARVADSVLDEVTEAIDIGLDVARERKGVIAGTIAAVLLWFFREPIVSAVSSLLGCADTATGEEEQAQHDKDQA